MDKNKAIDCFQEKFLGKIDSKISESLLGITSVIKVNKKKILFNEGESGEFVYFLLSGSIKLFRINFDGKECVIRFVNPNEIFAELLFSEFEKYPVSSLAVKDSVLLAISKSGFINLIKDDPQFTLKYISGITSRLKYFVDMVDNLTTSDVKNRLISYLTKLSEIKGSNTIVLPVPKGDLALLLGTTPESLSRTFRILSDEGVLEVSKQKIKFQAPQNRPKSLS